MICIYPFCPFSCVAHGARDAVDVVVAVVAALDGVAAGTVADGVVVDDRCPAGESPDWRRAQAIRWQRFEFVPNSVRFR